TRKFTVLSIRKSLQASTAWRRFGECRCPGTSVQQLKKVAWAHFPSTLSCCSCFVFPHPGAIPPPSLASLRHDGNCAEPEHLCEGSRAIRGYVLGTGHRDVAEAFVLPLLQQRHQ
ncbi:unnamed protein product, partial [Ectocarpus fasciculatus]